MPVTFLLVAEPLCRKVHRTALLPVVPSAVLNDTQCQSVWKMASPDGATLSGDKAVPYIVNFEMVDTNKDGTISKAEFKTGCGKGWIQSADASTIKELDPAAKL